MKKNYLLRRTLFLLTFLALTISWLFVNPASYETEVENLSSAEETSANLLASEVLEKLEVKGRAPKTGYTRDQFYSSWPIVDGCSLRQRIIRREMGETAVLSSENDCDVISGEFDEPYTGANLVFSQKSDFSKGIQIDQDRKSVV